MRMHQKTLGVVAALGMLCTAGVAQATVVLNISGATQSVATLDWSPGTSYAQGGNPGTLAGATTVAGIGTFYTLNSFPVYFQAQLGNYLSSASSNNTIDAPGLNGQDGKTPYYITLVAGFNEQGTIFNGLNSAANSATFTLDGSAPSYIAMYKTTVAPNNLTGVGFAPVVANDPNFTLLLAGTILNDGKFSGGFNSPNGASQVLLPATLMDGNANGDQWAGQTSVTGSGSTALNAQVTYYDNTYFQDEVDIITFQLLNNTSNVLPFSQSDPSQQLDVPNSYNITTATTFSYLNSVGTLGVVNGALGNGSGNIEFQTDANASFQASTVPEPSTFVLSGLGLLLAGGFMRRRRA
jgi:hypothetical protein